MCAKPNTQAHLELYRILSNWFKFLMFNNYTRDVDYYQ